MESFAYFPSAVYRVEKPEFLDNVKAVAEDYLNARKKEIEPNEVYPAIQTDNFFNDRRIEEFLKFVGQTSWDILQNQGFAMQDKITFFTEVWAQEHPKYSSMEQHIHGHGSQITGFYFLECPENCSKLLFHDPRIGKSQINLPQANENNVTLATEMVNFAPTEGVLFFTNSWLPHSFSRHANDVPLKFVHFNIAVQTALPNICRPKAEVI